MDWAAKPCSREWGESRPCAWFKAGERCNRAWVEFVGPTYFEASFLVVGYVNLSIIGVCLARRLRRAKSAYEKTVWWCLCSVVAQGVVFADVDGGSRRLPEGARLPAQALTRLFFEFALFETCLAYRKVLGAPGFPKFAAFAVATLLISGTGIAEKALVVPARRAACSNAFWNFLRNFATALLELGACVHTLRSAWRVRTELRRFSEFDRKAAVANIASRVAALTGLMSVVVAWGAYAGWRNMGRSRAVFCTQPRCGVMPYLTHNAGYAIGLVVIDWCVVLFLVPNRLVTGVLFCVERRRREEDGKFVEMTAVGRAPRVDEAELEADVAAAVTSSTRTFEDVERGKPGTAPSSSDIHPVDNDTL